MKGSNEMTKTQNDVLLVCNELENLYGGKDNINMVTSHWPIETIALMIVDACHVFMTLNKQDARFTAEIIKQTIDKALMDSVSKMVRH